MRTKDKTRILVLLLVASAIRPARTTDSVYHGNSWADGTWELHARVKLVQPADGTTITVNDDLTAQHAHTGSIFAVDGGPDPQSFSREAYLRATSPFATILLQDVYLIPEDYPGGNVPYLYSGPEGGATSVRKYGEGTWTPGIEAESHLHITTISGADAMIPHSHMFTVTP